MRVASFAVLVYLLLMPPQFIVEVGGLVLPPYRVFLIGAFFYILSSMARGRLKQTWPDRLVTLATAWIFIALSVSMGIEQAIISGGTQLIDIWMAYFFARLAIRTPRDFRIVLIMIVPGLFVIGGVMALESITRQQYLQPLASAITGRPYIGEADIRLGLMRARGPFPHPILAGMFLGSFLPLFALSGVKGWPRLMGIVAAAFGFFTLSSAAFLALVAGGALIAYNWLSERFVDLTWRIWLIMSGLTLFLLQFATESGAFSLLVRYAALNASSSYNRVLIWRFGSRSVAEHPLFGIGFNEWERPSWMKGSMDHYWLLLSVQYGLLPTIALLVAVLLAIIALGQRSAREGLVDQRLLRGVAIALGVMALGLMSVAVWFSAQVWLFALMGIATSLGYANRTPQRPRIRP